MKWQLYKRCKETLIASKAFESWAPMTEKEADNCAKAFQGTYQPKFTFFAARIDSPK